jgi:hypothetical protein
MAIVNKSDRVGEFVPRGAEPGLTRRFAWRDADQEKAVRDIAAQRFNFPNPDYPLYKTFTNRPERQIGVRITNGDLAFPDVVVVDRDTAVRLVGEVESHRSLRETPVPELKEKWSAFAGLAELYLFVPLASLDIAKRIIKQHGIPVRHLRTWRYVAGQDLLDITDI